jgi:hypothetical protein
LFEDFSRIEIFDHYLYLLFRSEIHIYSTNASQESDLLQILFVENQNRIQNLVFFQNKMYVMTKMYITIGSYPPRIFVFS